MELTCPSCAARYRVPEGALGRNSRQVSCSACGHGWHAAPPLVLGAGDATSAGTAEVHRLHDPEPGRTAQLAEIREQIADVQSHRRAPVSADDQTRLAADPERWGAQSTGVAAMPQVGAGTPTARPQSERTWQDDVGGAHVDPLRRRMAEHDARAAREREERERLRRNMRGSGESRGAGASLTGFLLVVIVAAALLAAYLLHPQIIARMPQTEPMLTEYVAWVNDLRAEIEQAWQGLRVWVQDLTAR